MIVVANTSPLNYLILIQQIALLPALFGEVVAPPAVAHELSHENAPSTVRAWIAAPPTWFAIRVPKCCENIPGLGAGETEAIALAAETKPALLLVDERGARQVAKMKGIPVLGTVGVLELASAQGRIDLSMQIPSLQRTNYQIDESILRDALDRDARRHPSNP